jgi:aminoglycoside phosphotransferase family enzyme
MTQATFLRNRSQQANSAAVVGFMRSSRHYPERPRRIEVIETHFAWIFLTDLHAYKLKKPIRRGRMDYTTVRARRRACFDELRLNRRLARTVYLEVVPLKRTRDGTIALGGGGPGRVVDWVVKMRRLPAARMLDRAIVERTVRKGDLHAVAAMLIHFFAGAARQPISGPAYIEHLSKRIAQNQRDLSASDLALDKHLVAEVAGLQNAFLVRHGMQVGARGEQLIDGHGDLRAEHVYLGSESDAPGVIDCLEFDSRLRWLDPAEEMAFLAVECRLLGGGAAARTLLSCYRAGTARPASSELIDFYASQSAMTRAKLAAWHLRDPAFAQHAVSWRARAQSYLLMAARYIRRASRKSQPDLSRSGSALGFGGPLLQQGRDRLPGQHAPDGFAE